MLRWLRGWCGVGLWCRIMSLRTSHGLSLIQRMLSRMVLVYRESWSYEGTSTSDGSWLSSGKTEQAQWRKVRGTGG